MNTIQNNTLGKTAALATATLGALALTAGKAEAQSAPTRFAVEAGANYLLDSDSRDTVGSTGVRVGVAYALPKGLLGSSSVAVDYTRHSKDGRRLENYGAWYQERIDILENAPLPLYATLGVGIVRQSVKSTREQRTVVVTPVPSGSGGYGPSVITVPNGPIALAAESVVVVNNGTTITTTTTRDIGISDDKWTAAARAALGTNFGSGFYAELGLQVSEKTLGVTPTSAQLSTGIRF
ncbi:hypothetical protein CMV30_08565 [Nibricoccus aquaticus]|uniref:Outer membrane protein beta-barrel domain-containing protein n=1 Tax=Nibricoccus aquaticus TaxID=2576891 RepID=A0A290Q685_9BACT|nr:hypothetical protein [Nibricoccus aquaticus]ATC63994.1 hypothetical protein CMV30_08565 [Nibricoccus aquaticus]